jgi:hypothetical protein
MFKNSFVLKAGFTREWLTYHCWCRWPTLLAPYGSWRGVVVRLHSSHRRERAVEEGWVVARRSGGHVHCIVRCREPPRCEMCCDSSAHSKEGDAGGRVCARYDLSSQRRAVVPDYLDHTRIDHRVHPHDCRPAGAIACCRQEWAGANRRVLFRSIN